MNKYLTLGRSRPPQTATEIALRKAFALGQTYWQQADSDSLAEHRRAGHTQEQFEALVTQKQFEALVTQVLESYQWQLIDTAPKDNKRPLLLASFNDDGTLESIDYAGIWESDRESWEIPELYYFWATANGSVEEPTHWMYEPAWYSKLTKEGAKS